MTKGTTQTIPAEDQQQETGYDQEMVDELLSGLPEAQKAVRLDRIAGDDPAAPKPPGFYDAPDGKVILLNLRFENEVFFMPEPDANNNPVFVGQTRYDFTDGYLLCSQGVADEIKERAPHVYQEPGPDSGLEIMEFPATKFKTRIPAALAEYSRRWAENQ